METWRTHVDPEEILEHGPWLRALARALVRDSAAADDLAQEAWLVAGRRGDLDTDRLRPFLAAVVRRLASRWRRTERRRGDHEAHAALGEAPSSPFDLAAQLELQEHLLQELRALDEPYRATLVMRFYGGQSSAEIARRTNTPDATVRARLARGLLQLRTRLERRGQREGRDWRAALGPLVGAASWDAPRAAFASLAIAAALCVGAGVAATALWRNPSTNPAPLTMLDAPAHANVEAPSAEAPAHELTSAQRSVAAAAPDPSPRVAHEGARIEARVVDEFGAPLEGVELELLFARTAERPRSGADGSVALEIDADLARQLDNGEDAVVQFARSGLLTERIGRPLRSGTTLRLGDVVMSRCGALAGRVEDSFGAPVSRARVFATLEAVPERFDPAVGPGPNLLWMALNANTDERGRFEFAELPVGHWNVWATSPRHPWVYVEGVEVRGGEREPILLRLPPEDSSHVIAGVLLAPDGAPVQAAVTLYGPEGAFDGRSACYSDAEGRFELRVDDPDSVWRLEARDNFATFALLEREVRAGEFELELRFEHAKSVQVRVVDLAGRPIRGASVFALDAEQGAFESSWTHSGSNGEALVTWPSRAVQVGVRAARHAPRNVTPSALDETVEIALGPGPGVTGRVERGGAPVSGASVSLLPAAPAPAAFVAYDGARGDLGLVEYAGDHPESFARTTEDGSFALALPPASPPRSYYLLVRAPDCAAAHLGPFELDPHSELDGLAVTLVTGGAVRGVVRADDRARLAGRSVLLANGFGARRELELDADGAFEAEHLTPGAWQACVVRSSANLHLTWLFEARAPLPAWSFEVVDGETSTCVLELPPDQRARIQGELVLRHEPPGVWRVRLIHLGERRSGSEHWLDADLRFNVEVERFGAYRVEVWSEDPRWGRAWCRSEVEVGPRGVHQRFELDFARVRGVSASGAERMSIVRALPDGGRFGCDFGLSAGGVCEERWAPAGSVLAFAGPWTEAAEAQGGGRAIELDRSGVSDVELP
jgi:RNA polymerase sigma-70 factor (ECF subfamily)